MVEIGKPGRPPVLRTSEKTLLHLLRLHGALSKAELARLSNMSAQGVSIIVERLLDLDLVRKGEKQRGKVGQPSTPIALNPEGAVAMGLFVGSGGARLVLTDFQGAIRAEVAFPCDDPGHPATARSMADAAAALPSSVDASLWRRGVGIGLSANEALLKRLDPRGGPGRAVRSSLAACLSERLGLPVHAVNDIRAACIAEMTVGADPVHRNTLYLNIGLSFGAGLILEGRLIGPETTLSSGLHRLALPGQEAVRVGDRVSLDPLAGRVEEAGFDFADQVEIGFSDTREIYEAWQGKAVEALAAAIAAATATLSVDRVLVASALARPTLTALVTDLRRALDAARDPRRPSPELSVDTVGPYPRAWGAAMVPFLKVFGVGENGVAALPDHRNVA